MVGISGTLACGQFAGCGGTSGSAASSALMPAAADCPTMPWCNTMRRSRNGRNTSVPAISTISNAWMLISPCDTRHTPSASAAAAPIATPQSVMPRVITPVDRTRRVLSHNSRALSASRRPKARLWPNAFKVGRPWTPSRNSEPNAFRACWRPWLVRRSVWTKTVGAIRVTSAKTSITVATGTSHQAIKAKIAIGVSTAIDSCGTYWPKKVCNCSTPSTIDSMTPPVRSPANQAGPSSAILS